MLNRSNHTWWTTSNQ